MPNREMAEEQITAPLKKMLRIATPADLKIVEENEKFEKDAFKICEEKIKKHQLEMKLVAVEYTFDHNKLLFSNGGFVGIKTGFTKRSGRCLVSAADRAGRDAHCRYGSSIDRTPFRQTQSSEREVTGRRAGVLRCRQSLGMQSVVLRRSVERTDGRRGCAGRVSRIHGGTV